MGNSCLLPCLTPGTPALCGQDEGALLGSTGSWEQDSEAACPHSVAEFQVGRDGFSSQCCPEKGADTSELGLRQSWEEVTAAGARAADFRGVQGRAGGRICAVAARSNRSFSLSPPCFQLAVVID